MKPFFSQLLESLQHVHVGWDKTFPSRFKKIIRKRNDPDVKEHADLEKYHDKQQGRKYKKGLDSISLPNTYVKGLHAIAHHLHGAAKEAYLHGHPQADNISKLAHHYSRKAEHYENFGLDKKIKNPKNISETLSSHKAFSQYHHNESHFYKGMENLAKDENDKSHLLMSASGKRHEISKKLHDASTVAHWIGLPEASKLSHRAMRESLRTNHFTEQHANSFNPAITRFDMNDKGAAKFYDRHAYTHNPLNKVLKDRYDK